MPDHEKNQPPPDDSIQRIADALRTALRLTGVSHRACERELGLSVGYLTRILAGQVQLRVSIVLGLCRMTGLPPAAFFSALFPDPQISEPTARVLRGLSAVHRRHPSSSGAETLSDDAPAPPGAAAPLPPAVSLEVVLLELRDSLGKLETIAGLPASASDPGSR